MRYVDGPIPLFAFQPCEGYMNFGEQLCCEIIKAQGFEVDFYSPLRPFPRELPWGLIAIGGLLNKGSFQRMGHVPQRLYVWGSGFHVRWREDAVLGPEELARCEFCAVRGHMTAKLYGVEHLPISDPGLLCPHFWRHEFAEPDSPALFVRHWADSNRYDLKAMGVDEECYTLLGGDESMDAPSECLELVRKIATARFVLTGSMHAAIVAEAYHVPWAIGPKGERDCATEWKWCDWAGSVMRNPTCLRTCATIEDGENWHYGVKPFIPVPRRMTDAFPFAKWESRK